jgi:hypothetical protein
MQGAFIIIYLGMGVFSIIRLSSIKIYFLIIHELWSIVVFELYLHKSEKGARHDRDVLFLEDP